MKDKTILITGGTGSFGSSVLKLLVSQNYKEIRIFSRDEKKQDDLRKLYKNPKVKFIIGDVRDIQSCHAATLDCDYIFHAAALKQVPSCEFYPMEAFKTNVLGTENLLNSAIHNNVSKVICLSTDKAVHPINAMGISKAMMEKVAISKAKESNQTIISVTRYGNVMGSRGSVIPLFMNQIKNKLPLTVTSLQMTRFMMSLDEAVKLVLFAFENARPGDIFIQKSPAASLKVLIDSLKIIFNDQNLKTNEIGFRHGEKLHETLCSSEERSVADDMGDYIRIPSDTRDLNYENFFTQGSNRTFADYTSENTYQLDPVELSKKITELNLHEEN